MTEDLYQKGLKVRRETLGDAYVDRALADTDDFTEDLQHHITAFAWGAVWGRDGLDRRARSLINLAMLSALNRPKELALHVRGALNNGVTREEIREVLLQVGVYCGAPAMLDAFRVARSVLDAPEDG